MNKNLLNFLKFLTTLSVLLCCAVLSFVKFSGYPSIPIEQLLLLETYLYWLLYFNRALVCLLGLYLFYQVYFTLKLEEKRVFLSTLLVDILHAVLLVGLAYMLLPALLYYNTAVVLGGLISQSLLELDTPIPLNVNEIALSLMNGGDSSLPKKEDEGAHVFGIRRISEKQGRVCLGVKTIVEAIVEKSLGKDSYLGQGAMSGFDAVQSVTGLPDTPCVDFDWPAAKK